MWFGTVLLKLSFMHGRSTHAYGSWHNHTRCCSHLELSCSCGARGARSERTDLDQVRHGAGAMDPLVAEGPARELDDRVLLALHWEGAEGARGIAASDHLGEDDRAVLGPVARVAAVVAAARLHICLRFVRAAVVHRRRGHGRHLWLRLRRVCVHPPGWQVLRASGLGIGRGRGLDHGFVRIGTPRPSQSVSVTRPSAGENSCSTYRYFAWVRRGCAHLARQGVAAADSPLGLKHACSELNGGIKADVSEHIALASRSLSRCR